MSTYLMNHTMIRVKDAEKSLKFYQDVMGMTLFRQGGNPDAGFTLYFLGYPGEQGLPKNGTADREGILELTWNHGTEKDEGFSYHNGNDQPQGFGHICECIRSVPLPRYFEADGIVLGISVDSIDKACERFESLNVNWKKRLTDGRMKNVAFVLDPDNYWIEVVQNEKFSGKDNF